MHRNACILIVLVVFVFSSKNYSQDSLKFQHDFKFLKPFESSLFGSDDIRLNYAMVFSKPNLHKIGFHVSRQSSAAGAGIYFFNSYNLQFYLPINEIDYGVEIDANLGVNIIGLGLTGRYINRNSEHLISIHRKLMIVIHRFLYASVGFNMPRISKLSGATKLNW